MRHSLGMEAGPEKTNFAIFPAKGFLALKKTLRVMEYAGCGLKRERCVRLYAGALPPALAIIHQKHMVSEHSAKAELVHSHTRAGRVCVRDFNIHRTTTILL